MTLDNYRLMSHIALVWGRLLILYENETFTKFNGNVRIPLNLKTVIYETDQ